MTMPKVAVGLMAAVGVGALLIASPIAANDTKTETRDVDAFTEIEVRGAVTLDLTGGKDQKVTVEAPADYMEKVVTEVKDGKLIIDMERNKSWWGGNDTEDVTVTITVPTLEALEVGGAVDGKLKDIKADKFSIDVGGAVNISIDGECGDLDVDAAGAADLDLRDFKCKNADVDIAGAGNGRIYASESIRAEISGVGSLTIYGKPAKVKKEINGIGSISDAD
ncbi:head GIN domain-containing protein [Pseudokordiimonas caeni]|uniref:head GIN domain-containing protein n=1 Tax=Pseudokordiimonas caeni TaxID=2997908 RepID=UPI0028118A1E|nr:head GIN domain-containing protein [Pseudokordiimonas caeni]